MKIAFVGECMVEFSSHRGGTQQSYGGDTLNTAVYFSRLNRHFQGGHQVQFFSAIGQDYLSDWLLREWQDEGLNTQYVYRDPVRLPGLYMIENEENGERNFLFWRSESAARAMFIQPQSEQWQRALTSASCLFVSGITLAILDTSARARLITCLHEAKADGAYVIFDNNYRARLWRDSAECRRAFETLYHLSDVALISLEDEQNVFGETDHESVAQRFQREYPQKLIIKDGGRRCWIQDHHNPLQTVMLDLIPKVVDTTAAGDSFNAGFLFAWLNGETIESGIKAGHELAKQVIQQQGAIIDEARMQYNLLKQKHQPETQSV